MPAISMGGSRLRLIKRVMMFVDGGYLREQMKKNCKDLRKIGDETKPIFQANLQTIFGKACGLFFPNTLADLIRIYYYDGVSDDARHEEIRKYHNLLRSMKNVQVITIPIVKSSKEEGYKQKGVDIQLAIDMLTKAYEDHYDAAFLLTGDQDFIPLVNAVKDDAGKKVYGIYFDTSFSVEMGLSFDEGLRVDKTLAYEFMM